MTTPVAVGKTVQVHTVRAEEKLEAHVVELPDYERKRFDDVAFMTAMNLCLMGNYAQTGHFGGPLAYHPLQRRLSSGRSSSGWIALRPTRAEVPFLGQVHARGWPLHPDLLLLVDDSL